MIDARKDLQAIATKLTADLTDRGKLIEAGWVGYRGMVVPVNATATQIEETRIAFFAGAQHLFTSIMNVLEPGTEPTDKDLKRMDMIEQELALFAKSMEAAGRFK